MGEKTILLLCDIDHTLTGEDSQHFQATIHALEVEYGLTNPSLDNQLHGLTQFKLLYTIATGNNICSKAALKKTPNVIQTLTKKYRENSRSMELHLLPGVYQALLHLQSLAKLGIITGNTEPIATIKLQRARISHFFSFGGYCTNERKRHRIYPKAIQDFIRKNPSSNGSTVPVVLGDTPYDIAVAEEVGILSIGVASGIFSREKLHDAGADLAIDSMEEYPKIVELIQNL